MLNYLVCILSDKPDPIYAYLVSKWFNFRYITTLVCIAHYSVIIYLMIYQSIWKTIL